MLRTYPWLYNPTDPSTFVPLKGPHPVTLRMNFRNSLCHTSSVSLTANNAPLNAHVLAVDALFQLGEVRKLGKGFFRQMLRVERRKIWCLLNLINERDPSSHSLRNSCGQRYAPYRYQSPCAPIPILVNYPLHVVSHTSGSP
jgi:hypothetical protein